MFRPTRSLRRAAVAAAWLAAASTAPALAAGPDKFAVPGLEKPATVLIDRWGVPHIYANTLYDAFFVQGFVAARDRLFQIDLWRKRGLGEMAKDFGPAYVEGDRMARAVLFRGDMYREWLAYGSDAKRVAEAFVAGVNAYIAQTEAHPELLPPEFKLINYKPSRWRAEDIVRIRHHGLTLNLTGEIDRAQIFCYAKPNAVRADWVRRELDPQIEPKVPDGLDPCTVPAAELRKAYELATAAPRFPKDVWQSGTRAENIPKGGRFGFASADVISPVHLQFDGPRPPFGILASGESLYFKRETFATNTYLPSVVSAGYRSHFLSSVEQDWSKIEFLCLSVINIDASQGSHATHCSVRPSHA